MRMYYLQAIQQVIAVEEAAKTVLHCLMTTHKDITLLHVPMSLSSYTR